MRKTSSCTKSRLALKIWSDGSSSWEISLGGKGRQIICKQDIFIETLWKNKNKMVNFSKQSRVARFQRKFKF
jgi:hypothetical protein